MRAACRPLCAAVCLLTTFLTGPSARAQQEVPKFLAQDIIQAAQPLNAEQRQKLTEFVDGHMAAMLAGDTQEISEARTTLLRPITTQGATDIFKLAISPLIADRLVPAAVHDNDLMRLNAMVIVSKLVGETVVPLINAGLADQNIAVRYWAVVSLRERARWLATQQAGNNPPQNINQAVNGLIAQVVGLLDKHPDVREVKVELEALFILNTPAAQAALIDQLNKRVALHAEDPALPWIGEQAVMQDLAQQAVQSRNFAQASSTGLARAAYRIGVLIATQLDGGKIEDEQVTEAATMLSVALTTLGQIGAVNGKNPPPAQAQLNGWILNSQWANVLGLLDNGWQPILMAPPFGLQAQDLALE